MKLPKLDYKKIAMQTAGEAAGLAVLGPVGKIKFVANAKPGLKGLIYKAIGVFLPVMAGKKGGALVDGASNALSVAGTSQIMAAFMPGKVPVIGEVSGYEDSPISGADEMEFVEGPNDEEEMELE